jgi:hypothetical protein
VERRGISLETADVAGVRYAADFGGRPAVIVPLHNQAGEIVSLHGRYLEHTRAQDKMFTIGPGGGVVNVLGGWRAEPLIVVEGLFDSLSLAVCGIACVATIGRWAPWLPEAAIGRIVWLAFDAGRPGNAQAASYAEQMRAAEVMRIAPPGRSKDWNTALVKQGRHTIQAWLRRHLSAKETG